MNIQRIWAVVLRHIYLAFRDLSRVSWMFWWPFFDIMTWGLVGFWVQGQEATSNIAYAQILALVVMQLLGRTSLDISISLMEELWSTNMINIFASPLRLSEWISATLIIGILSNTILLSYCATIVWLLFGFNIFSLGFSLLLFILPLLVCGIWIGFIAASLLIAFGARLQTFVFVLNWFFTPFCGVFYPVEVLPRWAYLFSRIIPMTYIVGALRSYAISGIIQWDSLLLGTGMGGAYALVSLVLFIYAFQHSKIKGFARLTAE